MKYTKIIFRYLKYFCYFIYSKKDLKYDFPFPPKPLTRLFLPQYYFRFFSYYYRRKKKQLEFFYNYKDYWRSNKWNQGDYVNWLKKLVDTHMKHIEYDENIKKIFQNNPRNILEVGAGSGHSAACILSYYLNYINFVKKKGINYNLRYRGLDLSEQRCNAAKKFTNIFFGQNRNNFELSFSKKDFMMFDLDTNKTKFDYLLFFSVFETISDKDIEQFVKKACSLTLRGIYITDLNDLYPGGYPRSHLIFKKIFEKFNFKLNSYKYKSVTTGIFKNSGKLNIFFERKK